MSIRKYLVLILTSFFVTGYAYSQCPALQYLLEEQTKALADATASRAAAWTSYTGSCGAGGATSSAGETSSGGSGNMCIYKVGLEFRYVNSSNTMPVSQCELLKCFSASIIGYLGGGLASIIEYIGIDSITDSVFVDSDITSACQASCKEWFTYGELINSTIPATIASLNAQSATLCASPCNGMTGDAYKKCECDRKDPTVWTWDTTKKDCVACKSKEGQGYEYQKCLCEKVNEGMWDTTDKDCYGKSCMGKTGDDYKKCICEIEKKGTWHLTKKVCNYVAPTPDVPVPGGSIESDGTVSSGTGGLAAEAGSGSASSGSTAGGLGGSAAMGGGVDDATQENLAKQKSGGNLSWRQRLLGAVGLGGAGNTIDGSGSAGRRTTAATKQTKQMPNSNVKGATDISVQGDDIFIQISKTYNARYQSELLTGKGAKSGI